VTGQQQADADEVTAAAAGVRSRRWLARLSRRRRSGGDPVPLRIPNVAIHKVLAWGGCAIVVLVVEVALAGRTGPKWPLAVTGLAFSAGFSYRVINNRSESPLWTAVIAAATHICEQPGMGEHDNRHAWWLLQTPCSRVWPS
jgi:hypothetical protein